MVKVTQRIKETKQPRGGYINPKTMEVRYLGGEGVAATFGGEVENIYPTLVGLAVDYLTRWSLDHRRSPNLPVSEHVFSFSLSGARALDKEFGTSYGARAADLCRLIDESREVNPNELTPPTAAAVLAAVELTSFDVAFHAGVHAFNRDAELAPDEITVQHIGTMIDRSLAFFRQYGPVTAHGFLAVGGDVSGIGDFVTADTLWDFKVSTQPPTIAHTLQLLMLWIMVERSDWNWQPLWNTTHLMSKEEWAGTWDLEAYLRDNHVWPDDLHGPAPTHIGIYNPRLNAVYRLAIGSIPADVIAEVARDVIGFE